MTWLCIGDSITERNYRSAVNYHDIIAHRLALDVVNAGVSGSGFIRRRDEGLSYAARLRPISPAPEIVTVMGSYNDLAHEPEVQGGLEEELREAVDSFLSTLVEWYPLSFIGLLTPPPREHVRGFTWYCRLLEEMARRHSLPFLDLATTTALRPWIEVNRRTYFSCPACPEGDGVHPNELGHRLLAAPIEAFLRRCVTFPQPDVCAQV